MPEEASVSGNGDGGGGINSHKRGSRGSNAMSSKGVSRAASMAASRTASKTSQSPAPSPAARLSISGSTRGPPQLPPVPPMVSGAAVDRQGSQWSGVPNVKGKVTNRCLWHACKAVSLGVLLLMVGAIMSTFGYYAEALSTGEETRGNATVRVRNDARGFHLNNLSYAGPIIMGVGGFIIVAACVMTFEARDSAAKVVPARFITKGPGRAASARGLPLPYRSSKQSSAEVRSTSSQTYWDSLLARSYTPPRCASPGSHELQRKAITTAFLQFSRTLQSSMDSGGAGPRISSQSQLHKCPSAPNVAQVFPVPLEPSGLPHNQNIQRVHYRQIQQALNKHHQQPSPKRLLLLHSASGARSRERFLLSRQAMSVDAYAIQADSDLEGWCRGASGSSCSAEAGTEEEERIPLGASATGVNSGSEDSMAMDLHLPDCSVTIKVRDESRSPGRRKTEAVVTVEATEKAPLLRGPPKEAAPRASPNRGRHMVPLRSETSRRHLFTRQKPVNSLDSDKMSDSTAEEGGKELG